MKMVYNIGINDMPKGWKRKTKWNLRVYNIWHDMLMRCYDEKYLQKYPTYKDCYVCERWHRLSNFVEDIIKIDNYDMWLNNPCKRISLDKDIKSKGEKCYCLDKCMFVTNSDNSKAVRKMNDFTGINHPRCKKINQYNIDGNFIKTWDYAKQASITLNINYTSINACLKGRQKSAGGFLWKYTKESSEKNE